MNLPPTSAGTPLPISDDDWLDRALRDDASAARYIDDGGFTARVMDTLPPSASALPSWRRPAIALMWTAAGAAAIVTLPGTAADIVLGAARLVVAQPISLAQIGVAVAALAATMWGAAAYTLRDD